MNDQKLKDVEVLVLTSGVFGKAVTERLLPLFRGTVQDIEHGTHPSLWPHAHLVVLATSPERPRIADAVDRAAFVRGIPWLPVIARATDLQVGPVVVPGRTPCHRCHVRRRNQHSVTPVVRDAAPQAESTGFARHHVSIAVALARQALLDAVDPDASADLASVRRYNLVNGSLSRASVIAADGCDRCRGRFGSREEFRQGLWAQLESALPVAEDAALLTAVAR